MSKRLIWIIVIIALIAIVGSVIFLSNAKSNKEIKDQQNTNEDNIRLANPGSDIENTPESEFSDLETSNDDFNEIDSSLNYVE